MKDIGKQLEGVGTTIMDLFGKDGSITAEKLIQVGKAALKAGVNSVRSIIKALLKLVANLILKIRDLGNTPINIPIFTWLYKQINNGNELTLFDAISLVIAVPTTVFAKLITGKAPPKLPNMNATMLGQLLFGDSAVDEQTKVNFNILKIEVAVGLTLSSAAFSVLKLLVKAFTGGPDATMEAMKTGPSGFFDVFGIAVDIIGTLVALPDSRNLPGAECRNWVGDL